jgi:very-short-patch-repair endonuclease/phosphoribosylcarboxyaminoimidazole (NCAIR) mutase
MRGQNRNARVIARIADANHGVVVRAQLIGAGVSSAAIDRRLANGTLLFEYPGVYRVGHRAPSAAASYLAAVRACGERTVLSGRAAAHLWGLVKGRAPVPEVSAPTERRIEGLRARRRQLERTERTTHRGIPITSIPLTLVDLAAHLPPQALSRACHEAGVRYRTTPREVSAILARRPNSPGAAKLRAILAGDQPVTLSELERRFIALLRSEGLPLPQTNKPASGRRVDCRWPEHRLTVELDGYRYHTSRHAWEQDRRREREAYARGDEFRRYTYGDVCEDPRPMLAELRALLSGPAKRTS